MHIYFFCIINNFIVRFCQKEANMISSQDVLLVLLLSILTSAGNVDLNTNTNFLLLLLLTLSNSNTGCGCNTCNPYSNCRRCSGTII